jgi:hypothetical protein
MRRRAGGMHSMAGMSQQWKRFTSWFGGKSRAAQIGLGCAALIALCACGSTTNAGVTATSTHAARTATPKPSSGPAVLGGSGQAFIDRYGPLTSQSDLSAGDLHFRQYPGVALDFLIVDLGKRLADTPGDNNAASIVVAAPPDQKWTMTEARTQCGAFLPADAKMGQSVPVPAGHAVDYIYHSDTLAHVFAAAAFQDAQQNSVPPGTFDVLYLYASANATDQIVACDLELGSQQTT